MTVTERKIKNAEIYKVISRSIQITLDAGTNHLNVPYVERSRYPSDTRVVTTWLYKMQAIRNRF